MTQATFSTNKKAGSITLKVTGHAGYAEHGKDIICAAASILMYTLAQTVSFMHQEGKLQKKPNIRMKEAEGEAIITVKPKDEWYGEALHAYFVTQVGYHLLCHNYPEYVALNSFSDKA